LIPPFRVSTRTEIFQNFETALEHFQEVRATQVGNPGIVLGAVGYGVIGSAVPARQVHLGLRYAF